MISTEEAKKFAIDLCKLYDITFNLSIKYYDNTEYPDYIICTPRGDVHIHSTETDSSRLHELYTTFANTKTKVDEINSYVMSFQPDDPHFIERIYNGEFALVGVSYPVTIGYSAGMHDIMDTKLLGTASLYNINTHKYEDTRIYSDNNDTYVKTHRRATSLKLFYKKLAIYVGPDYFVKD